MKKIIYLFTLLPVITFAQETVKKRIWPSYGITEVYYVLKSDKKIKHGSYEKLQFGNNVLIQGYYKNDLRDSAWIEWWSPHIFKSKGSYVNGERVGVWEFYNRTGVLEQKYDHTTKQFLYDQSLENSKEKIYRVIKGSDTIETKLERPPVYIGGKTRLHSATGKGFNFPPNADMTQMAGKILVSFIIDTSGKAVAHKILAGIGNVFDEEALRMAKQIPDSWAPGILNGEPVNVEYILTIDFKNIPGK